MLPHSLNIIFTIWFPTVNDCRNTNSSIVCHKIQSSHTQFYFSGVKNLEPILRLCQFKVINSFTSSEAQSLPIQTMQENALFHDSAQLYSWVPMLLQSLQNLGGWPLCLCTGFSFLGLGLQLPLGFWRYQPSSSQLSFRRFDVSPWVPDTYVGSCSLYEIIQDCFFVPWTLRCHTLPYLQTSMFLFTPGSLNLETCLSCSSCFSELFEFWNNWIVIFPLLSSSVYQMLDHLC